MLEPRTSQTALIDALGEGAHRRGIAAHVEGRRHADAQQTLKVLLGAETTHTAWRTVAADVDVGIDEAREQREAAAVDHLDSRRDDDAMTGAARNAVLADASDASILDDDILMWLWRSAGPVDDGDVTDEEIVGRAGGDDVPGRRTGRDDDDGDDGSGGSHHGATPRSA
jgi:hypothetical protein